MWCMIESLRPVVEPLAPVFTLASSQTSNLLLLSWVLCLGKRTLGRVGENVHPESPPDHSQRHHLDSYYNFFERSAWSPAVLA